MVYKIFFTLLLVILVVFQNSNQNFLNLLNKNSKTTTKKEEQVFYKTSSNPLSSFFENFKPTPIENESILVVRSDPNFKAFIQKNAFYNVLEAVKSLNLKTKIYQASTSELYGQLKKNNSINEKTPFNPVSPYGVAKLYSYEIMKTYRNAYGIFASNGILR